MESLIIEAYVKRKQWIIIGIIIMVLLAMGFTLWQNNRPDDITETGKSTAVLDLAYCADEQVNPCVVSFSLDADENMLVNFSSRSYPSRTSI